MANVAQITEHATWTKAGPVMSHMPVGEIMALEERAVATIADPTTLGLFGFATGTWIAGLVIAGYFPPAAMAGVAPVLLVFAGLAQFIAGLFAFRRVNTFAATAFCSFGAFNVTTALLTLLQARGILPMTGDPAVLQGLVLESFGFIALVLTIAALPINAALVLVLGTLTVGYACAGVPQLADAVGKDGYGVVGTIGGWFLIVSAAAAYYTAAAMVVSSTWKRTVLPIGGEP